MREITSRVEAVTVYRQGAMVTRVAELEAARGDGFEARVALVGLPLSLDDASIRVEVHAEGEGAPPVAGDVAVTVSVPAEDATLPPPDDAELEAAQLAHAKAERDLVEIKTTIDRLSALTVEARGEPEEGTPPAPSPTAARLELLAFRRRRGVALHTSLAEAREALHLAQERHATLRERKRIASSHRNTATWEVRKVAVVRLEDPGSSPCTRARMRVMYFVPGARWAPAYTVRLASGLDRGTLEVRALVAQATGEDWRGVSLTLSTARPQQWTELPELRSQRIGRSQPEPAKTGWRPAPEGAAELYADYDRDLPKRPPPPPKPVARAKRLAPSEDRGVREELLVDEAPVAAGAPIPRAPPPAAPEPSRTAFAGPAAPAAAPPPQALPQAPPGGLPPDAMLRAETRSGGLGAMIGGVVGAAVGGATAVFGGGGEGAPPAETSAVAEPEARLLAGRDLLDYGRLQLYGADESRRGSLRRVDARVVYEHALLRIDVLSIDVAFQRISAAVGRARALDGRGPPPRHHEPAAEAGFDYAYVADGPIELDSDGKFHALPVLAASADAMPRYVSVPRETQDVFRIVALRNPLAAPVLPGPADVYVDGKFVLTSQLELTPADGRVELGLGVEQAIKIARNIEFEEDTSGLIKRQHDLVHTIKIEVANHLRHTATVEIRERVPVVARGEDDVEIEERDASPAWEDYDQDPEPLEGGRVWKVDVQAGANVELTASWVASVPSGYELVGGNRRES